jgi:hypothetical protein
MSGMGCYAVKLKTTDGPKIFAEFMVTESSESSLGHNPFELMSPEKAQEGKEKGSVRMILPSDKFHSDVVGLRALTHAVRYTKSIDEQAKILSSLENWDLSLTPGFSDINWPDLESIVRERLAVKRQQISKQEQE